MIRYISDLDLRHDSTLASAQPQALETCTKRHVEYTSAYSTQGPLSSCVESKPVQADVLSISPVP